MRDMPDTPMNSGSRWGILLGLTFIVALGLAVLILWPSLRPAQRGGNVLSLIPLPQEPTARQAYQAAQEVARAWQMDARLASLSAQWRPIRGRWPAQTVWMAQFYSPAAGRMAVVVAERGRARLIQEMASPYPLPTLAEERWRVDSPQALSVWWENGGEDFLARHTEVEVTARLKPFGSGDDRPVWTITAVAGNQVHTVTLSGVDGQRIP